MKLANRIALVTGASRGIGREIALALAREGADLVVTSTQEKGTDEVAQAIKALGRRVVPVVYDAGSPTEADRLVATALQTFERVDILVNNAGMAIRAPMAEMTDAAFERVLAVNLHGPFYLSRRLVPLMAARGYGRVINVSSVSSRTGTPTLTAYCASKWGLNGLTQAMAKEVAGQGVLVAAVLPGSVATRMLDGSGFEPQMEPGDVAGVVRYLCVDAPQAMNGSLVEVFG